jgi:hypothetical protein
MVSVQTLKTSFLGSRGVSIASSPTKILDQEDCIEIYKQKLRRSLVSPDVFASISECVLREMEYSKNSYQSLFTNTISQTISNDLVLPVARFQALFYLKLATERTNMNLLKVIAGHQELIDTLQQQTI